jgi:exodeoxyribonuclease VII small subunit
MSDTSQEAVPFEQALEQLEQIVRALEEGDTGLEQSLAHYEQGVGLLKQCYAHLRQAEQRIQTLTGETVDGQPVAKKFEHAATLELKRPKK